MAFTVVCIRARFCPDALARVGTMDSSGSFRSLQLRSHLRGLIHWHAVPGTPKPESPGPGLVRGWLLKPLVVAGSCVSTAPRPKTLAQNRLDP